MLCASTQTHCVSTGAWSPLVLQALRNLVVSAEQAPQRLHCHEPVASCPIPRALQSAAVHITCSGVFLTVKRKVAAAYAAHLASHTSLAGAPPHSLLGPGAPLQSVRGAGGSKCSSPGSAVSVPRCLAAQEGKEADSVETKAPLQNLEEGLQAVASTRTGAKRDAAVMQHGCADDAEHAGAAADGPSTDADFSQQAEEWVEPVCGSRHALEPAPVWAEPARLAVGTPPLSCKRRVRKFVSRSDQKFQVRGAAGALLSCCGTSVQHLFDYVCPYSRWVGAASLSWAVLFPPEQRCDRHFQPPTLPLFMAHVHVLVLGSLSSTLTQDCSVCFGLPGALEDPWRHAPRGPPG